MSVNNTSVSTWKCWNILNVLVIICMNLNLDLNLDLKPRSETDHVVKQIMSGQLQLIVYSDQSSIESITPRLEYIDLHHRPYS